MKKNFFLVLLILTGYTWGQSTGGVQKPTIYLKGDSKPKQDNSSTDVNPSISLLNFNAAYDFNGQNNSVFFPVQLNDFSQVTVFVVYRNDKPGIEQNIWKINGSYGTTVLTTKKVDVLPGELSYKTEKSNSAIINTYIKRWKTQDIYEADHQGLFLGKNENGIAAFKGKIAEYLLYDRVLTASEQRRIESYLAIKYGVSLTHDYINSFGKTLWSIKKNTGYNNRIIGIGRDVKGDVYQKQSENKDESFWIEIGAGSIETSNAQNKTVINDQDFLLLGDNDGEIRLESPKQSPIPISILNRRWLINVTGRTTNSIVTELKINIAKIGPERLPVNNYVLAIDRRGTGDFSSDKTEYFIANDLSEDGVLTFKNIFWDTDHSGMDVFSFGTRSKDKFFPTPDLTENDSREIILYPNPASKGYFNLDIRLEKPAALQVEVYDEKGSLVQTMFGNEQKYFQYKGRITGGAGVYTFLITTPYLKISRRLVVQ